MKHWLNSRLVFFCVSYEVGFSVTGWTNVFQGSGLTLSSWLNDSQIQEHVAAIFLSPQAVRLLNWKMYFGEKFLLKFFKLNNCICKQSVAAGCCPWETVLRTEVAGECWGAIFPEFVLLGLCVSPSAYSLIKTKCFPAPCVISRSCQWALILNVPVL